MAAWTVSWQFETTALLVYRGGRAKLIHDMQSDGARDSVHHLDRVEREPHPLHVQPPPGVGAQHGAVFQPLGR